MQTKKSLTLLYVEDNEDDLRLLQETLKPFDSVSVNTAKDGVEAISYLRQQGTVLPDMILLDIWMPRKNGFEVLKEIKSDPFLRRLPVVMFTTSSVEEDVIQSYEGGACSYIVKPSQFSKLQKIIHSFIPYWLKTYRRFEATYSQPTLHPQ